MPDNIEEASQNALEKSPVVAQRNTSPCIEGEAAYSVFDEFGNALSSQGIIPQGLATLTAKWAKEQVTSYKKLMGYYQCALMEVETKFRVLNQDFSIFAEGNPIENIKSRLKSPESIAGKLMRRGYPLTPESIEQNLFDVAGVRIICTFLDQVYDLADALLKQDDVILIEKKDYIANPKPNGYRSLHLIVRVPIFLHNEKRLMPVEVQLRTLSMDSWASLEHKVCYKKTNPALTDEIREELRVCADYTAEVDRRASDLRARVSHAPQ